MANGNRFESTYEYKRLLEKHALDEYGFWQIYGEDPNCDWGGSHHNPFLGTVEGILADVIKYAENLDRFWQWGAGGSIKKTSIITVS